MDNYYYIIFKYIYKYILLVLFCVQPSFAQNQQDIQIANDYYLRGDKPKALAAFQNLAKDFQNISAIHSNYLSLLLDLGQYKQAEDYVEKVIRRDDRITYKLDLGMVYLRSGDVTKADKYLKAIIKAQSEDMYRAKSISDFLASRNLIDYSIYSLQCARTATKNPFIFFLEMANLYRLQGKRDEMVNEYLEYVTQTPGNIGYVKNLLQILLTKPEELESLERLLMDRVQGNPQSEVFIDLLIWTQLQQKNFYGAFVQARAYDKRFRKDQSKTLEIAQIALNNQDYTNADKAFSYVVKEFVNTENYLPAQLGLIKTREAKVKKSYPVNTDSVKYLIVEYMKFCNRYPSHPSAYEARLSQAMLFANYLNELDSSILRIQRLIGDVKTPATLRNQAKIDLGDIYLLKSEPWESTLLYSQVEKSQRETPLGYEAKLRNAKLSYYKGDFKLAQEHLDILKQATTREIANDAMDLSMRIKENTAFDTTGFSLRQLANIEFLIYQNQLPQATKQLLNFESNKVLMKQAEAFLYGFIDVNTLVETEGDYIWVTLPPSYVNNAIQDDVFWLEANLNLRQGKYDVAIGYLEKIIQQFGEDVLADDAAFMQAEIYDLRLNQKEKAKELYRTFLDKYAGSVYAAEARKRYRTLRGDFVEGKEVN
ncbi:MAG: tetratricopeptide repeat protein [Bacteroidetes bacterium]|nr:tetratricopeptide repeat protein [Bacteroidota bacterium]